MTPPLLNRKRMEDMVFNYFTTTRSDFKDSDIKHLPEIVLHKEKEKCLMRRPPHLKGIHTLTAWKGKPISFSFTHKPKEIVNTDPRNVQEVYIPLIDHERENVQKTRPRLVMTPAVSMDDIEETEVRNILAEDMYTSNTARATKEAVSPYFSVRAPLPTKPSPANPIFLPRLQPPIVPPEWRMESVSWDKKGLRTFCNPTAEFWKRTGSVHKCDKCKETRNVESHLKMIQQMPSRRT